jgi:hypothetical protein
MVLSKETNMKRIFLSLLVVVFSSLSIAAPLGTQFTFQGELHDQAMAANGNYDFQFEVFDALAAGNSLATMVAQTATNRPVTNATPQNNAASCARLGDISESGLGPLTMRRTAEIDAQIAINPAASR